MKSYIINLDRNPERLAHIDSRFKQLGLSYERIAAVDGKAVPREQFESFAAARPMDGTGDSYTNGKRTWNPSSMGCFLSHYEAWKRIAEGENEYAAVFEDDIHISEKIVELLSSDQWIPENCDIIKLEPSYNRIRVEAIAAARIAGHAIARLIPTRYEHCWPICTGGMIISRKTAQKLLSTSPQEQMIADIFLFSFTESPLASTLNTYQIYPAICAQDKFMHTNQNDVVFKSEIEVAANGGVQTNNRIANIKKKVVAAIRELQGYHKILYQG